MDEDFSGYKGCIVADIMKASMLLHQIVQAVYINSRHLMSKSTFEILMFFQVCFQR